MASLYEKNNYLENKSTQKQKLKFELKLSVHFHGREY